MYVDWNMAEGGIQGGTGGKKWFQEKRKETEQNCRKRRKLRILTEGNVTTIRWRKKESGKEMRKNMAPTVISTLFFRKSKA